MLRALSSKVLPCKPEAGQYNALRATPTARAFFPANFYPPSLFPCIFFQTSPEFFLCWLWSTQAAVWARRMKGQPAHRYRQLMQVPVLSSRGMEIVFKTCFVVFCFLLGLRYEIVDKI